MNWRTLSACFLLDNPEFRCQFYPCNGHSPEQGTVPFQVEWGGDHARGIQRVLTMEKEQVRGEFGGLHTSDTIDGVNPGQDETKRLLECRCWQSDRTETKYQGMCKEKWTSKLRRRLYAGAGESSSQEQRAGIVTPHGCACPGWKVEVELPLSLFLKKYPQLCMSILLTWTNITSDRTCTPMGLRAAVFFSELWLDAPFLLKIPRNLQGDAHERSHTSSHECLVFDHLMMKGKLQSRKVETIVQNPSLPT